MGEKIWNVFFLFCLLFFFLAGWHETSRNASKVKVGIFLEVKKKMGEILKMSPLSPPPQKTKVA